MRHLYTKAFMRYNNLQMPFYKSEAIVLKTKPFAEADKLVTLFSRERGKFQVVARGARRSRSRFGGRLEIFSYNNFFIAKTKGLDVLSQVDSKESFRGLREDLPLLETGCYLVKMVDSVSPMGKSSFPLFRLLLWSLYLLKKGINPDFVARIFEAKLSHLEGVFPVLDHCVKCAKKAPRGLAEISFSFAEGGIICSRCAKLLPVAKIPYEIIQMSRDFAQHKFEVLAKKKIKTELLAEMQGFFCAYLKDKFEIDRWENCVIS